MEYYLAFKKEILSYTTRMKLEDIQPIPLQQLKAGIQIGICTPLFISVLLTIAKIVEITKYLPTEG